MRKLTIGSHLLAAIAVASLLAFLAIAFYYILLFHVSPLSRDQWHMYAPYFERGLWETMLSPMSTHRHVFPYLLFHADMQWFQGNNHLLIASGTLFNLLLVALFIRHIGWAPGLPWLHKLAMTVFVLGQMFWLINIAQLGWGFMSTQYYLAILSLFASIICAYSYCEKSQGHPGWLAGCLLCGVVSTFSFGMGILVWPILLYFLWGWRAINRHFIYILAGLLSSLILFLVLPGGDSIRESIAWSPSSSLKFIFQLNGGPVFYIFKSWRLLNPDHLKQAAVVIGGLATAAGILILAISLIHRRRLAGIEMLAHALMLTGLGTATLVSITRSPYFLDPWVDRYQIWSVLFWTGLMLLTILYARQHQPATARRLLPVFLFFPLLAMPSQLDFGSRLYEYKVRVQEALVFYQLGIADQNAAQDALHWNWEHKLPYFFSTLKEIRIHKKNIFSASPADYVGKPVEALTSERSKSIFTCLFEQDRQITPEQLLDMGQYQGLDTISREWIHRDSDTDSNLLIARQISANVPDDLEWEYAVSVSADGRINGVGIHIHHSALPRPVRTFTRRKYNMYGVMRGNGMEQSRWYLLGSGPDTKRVGICEQAVRTSSAQDTQ